MQVAVVQILIYLEPATISTHRLNHLMNISTTLCSEVDSFYSPDPTQLRSLFSWN